MTDKELFLQIKTHLLTQGKQCIATYKDSLTDREVTSCAYRSPEGLKCAVGCIIKDEYYTPELEGRNVLSITVKDAVVRSLGLEFLPNHTHEMLSSLQDLHDIASPSIWGEELRAFEGMFNSEGSYIY